MYNVANERLFFSVASEAQPLKKQSDSIGLVRSFLGNTKSLLKFINFFFK